MRPLFIDHSTAHLYTSVLLIQHETDDFHMLARALQECNPYFCLLRASNLEAGLELVESKKIDCVVLDLDLPDSACHALVEALCRHSATPLAVVVITRLRAGLANMALHTGVGAHAWLVRHTMLPSSLAATIESVVRTVRSPAARSGAGERHHARRSVLAVEKE